MFIGQCDIFNGQKSETVQCNWEMSQRFGHVWSFSFMFSLRRQRSCAIKYPYVSNKKLPLGKMKSLSRQIIRSGTEEIARLIVSLIIGLRWSSWAGEYSTQLVLVLIKVSAYLFLCVFFPPCWSLVFFFFKKKKDIYIYIWLYTYEL